jgi:hypothetical protein
VLVLVPSAVSDVGLAVTVLVVADAIADLETPKGAVGSRPQLMVNVSVATANNAARRKTRGRLGPTVTWPMDPPAPCRS